MNLKTGQQVLLKTKEELLASGYREESSYFCKDGSPTVISPMHQFLGKIVTIGSIYYGNCNYFIIKEDIEAFHWGYDTIADFCETEEVNKCHISLNEIFSKSFKLEEQNEKQ